MTSPTRSPQPEPQRTVAPDAPAAAAAELATELETRLAANTRIDPHAVAVPATPSTLDGRIRRLLAPATTELPGSPGGMRLPAVPATVARWLETFAGPDGIWGPHADQPPPPAPADLGEAPHSSSRGRARDPHRRRRSAT